MNISVIREKCGRKLRSRAGMELVQVAILIGIAVALGLIFKSQITSFVNDIFDGLSARNYLS